MAETAAPLQLSLSPLDFQRFGIRVAKAVNVTHESVHAIAPFCREQNVELCIARCASTENKVVHALEEQGFQLMDTLIYYVWRLHKKPDGSEVPEGTVIRLATPADAVRIRQIAERCFKDYDGHYHNDPRLPRSRCDDVYADWAYRHAMDPNPAKAVLVAAEASALSGFATLELRTAEEGEGVLFAVDPSAQGKGLYRCFMLKAAEWCAARGARRMVVSTQITNIMVQKVWSKLGLEPLRSFYTFHGWFSRPEKQS